MLSVDLSDFRRAAEAVSGTKLRQKAAGTIRQTLRDAGNIERKHIRATIHRRSGKAQAKVTVFTSGTGLDTKVRVHAGGKIAHLIESGAKAHEIKAGAGRGQLGVQQKGHGHAMTIRGSGASNSAFSGFGSRMVKGAGQIVAIRTVVHHPGMRGQHFFEKGMEQALPEVQTRVNEGAQKLQAELVAGFVRSVR